jgi:CDP-glucose 4,6-dehydratase
LAARQTENPATFADAFNFGPHLADNLTVQQITEEAIKIWGSGTYEVPETSNTLHEAGLLQLDITKAQNLLGWKPRNSAQEAIAKTIDWYRNYSSNKIDIADFTRNQINEFTK